MHKICGVCSFISNTTPLCESSKFVSCRNISFLFVIWVPPWVVCILESFLCLYLAPNLLTKSFLLFGKYQFCLSLMQPLPPSSWGVHLLLNLLLLYCVQDRLLLLYSLIISILMYNVQVEQLHLLRHSLYSRPFATLEVLLPPPFPPLEVMSWLSNILVFVSLEQCILVVSYLQWLLHTKDSPLDLRNSLEPWEAHFHNALFCICPLLCFMSLYWIALPLSTVPPGFLSFLVCHSLDCISEPSTGYSVPCQLPDGNTSKTTIYD